jgi:hypothetical protein
MSGVSEHATIAGPSGQAFCYETIREFIGGVAPAGLSRQLPSPLLMPNTSLERTREI